MSFALVGDHSTTVPAGYEMRYYGFWLDGVDISVCFNKAVLLRAFRGNFLGTFLELPESWSRKSLWVFIVSFTKRSESSLSNGPQEDLGYQVFK